MVKRKKKRFSGRNLITLVLLIALFTYLFISGYCNLKKVSQGLLRIEAENTKLLRENMRLEEEIKAFRGDPSYIEKIAREKLNMIKKGEVVYKILPPEESGQVQKTDE